MATKTWNTVNNPNSDANYQAWLNGISDAIGDLLVKTADTGQISLPFVGARPAAGAFSGYEVFRFDDVEQATLPIFLKVEYGLHATTTVGVIRFNIGTGTDGAGTITGLLAGPQTVAPANETGVAGTVYEHAAMFNDGAFALAMDVVANDGGCLFGFERPKDPDLAHKAGLYYFWRSATATISFNTKPPPPAAAAAGGSFPVLFGGTADVLTLGGDIPVYPVEPFLGRRQAPMRGIVVVNTTDIGPGVQLQTTMYSETHIFRRVTKAFTGLNRGGVANSALAIRWE